MYTSLFSTLTPTPQHSTHIYKYHLLFRAKRPFTHIHFKQPKAHYTTYSHLWTHYSYLTQPPYYLIATFINPLIPSSNNSLLTARPSHTLSYPSTTFKATHNLLLQATYIPLPNSPTTHSRTIHNFYSDPPKSFTQRTQPHYSE
jgi:hypothetical protein